MGNIREGAPAPKGEMRSTADQLDTPEGRRAIEKVRRGHQISFVKTVRGASSVEEALRFAPGTSLKLLAFLDPEGREEAKRVAAAMKEKLRPIIEKIRSAKSWEGMLAESEPMKDLFEVNLWDVLEVLNEQERKRSEEK